MQYLCTFFDAIRDSKTTEINWTYRSTNGGSERWPVQLVRSPTMTLSKRIRRGISFNHLPRDQRRPNSTIRNCRHEFINLQCTNGNALAKHSEPYRGRFRWNISSNYRSNRGIFIDFVLDNCGFDVFKQFEIFASKMEANRGFDDSAVPINTPYGTQTEDLNIDDAVEILLNPDMTRVSDAPAALPKAGEIYVFVFDQYLKSDISRIRSDGYTWYSCSGKVITSKARAIRVQKYYWTVQSILHAGGDHRFKRQEFRLAMEDTNDEPLREGARPVRRPPLNGPFVVLHHYLGDERVATVEIDEGELTADGSMDRIPTKRSRPSTRKSAGANNHPSMVFASSAVDDMINNASDHISTTASISGHSINNHSGHRQQQARLGNRSELISVPSLLQAAFRSQAQQQIKTEPRSSESNPILAGRTEPSPMKKPSKNNLLGQQVEATLDALEGDELIAAREEIFDFLRKWDKD